MTGRRDAPGGARVRETRQSTGSRNAPSSSCTAGRIGQRRFACTGSASQRQSSWARSASTISGPPRRARPRRETDRRHACRGRGFCRRGCLSAGDGELRLCAAGARARIRGTRDVPHPRARRPCPCALGRLAGDRALPALSRAARRPVPTSALPDAQIDSGSAGLAGHERRCRPSASPAPGIRVSTRHHRALLAIDKGATTGSGQAPAAQAEPDASVAVGRLGRSCSGNGSAVGHGGDAPPFCRHRSAMHNAGPRTSRRSGVCDN